MIQVGSMNLSPHIRNKKMESCYSKDLLNSLPDPLLCFILSFLPTKEAASTSILSRRWRYLLAFVPSLKFDDSVYLHPEERITSKLGLQDGIHIVDVNNKRKKLDRSFQEFVTRILNLQGNAPIDKFVLQIVDEDDPVETECVVPWINNVLARHVSDFYLKTDLKWKSSLPLSIFLTETLVKLRICIRKGPKIDVGDVRLPKLKTLYLEYVKFKEKSIGFSKLLSGCCVLEELVLEEVSLCKWDTCSVSVTTLKRLTVDCSHLCDIHENIAKSLSFDAPNVVYLVYREIVAKKYPKVNFRLLVEAKIDLQMTHDQSDEEEEDQIAVGYDENYKVGNVTDFLMGISNVRILCLSANTLEVLTFCCKKVAVFSNVTHLTIESKPEVGWESLPGLLNNCPNLETLVFQGLLHKTTEKCGDVCLCIPRKEEDDVSSCLCSSLVKVLKILMNDSNMEKQIEQVKYFLETMPLLEQLILYYESCFDEEEEVTTQLQMLTSVASPKCKVKLIPGNFKVPSDVLPSASTMWVPLP